MTQGLPLPNMRDATADLRDLGRKLEECSVAHRCWSQAAPYVLVLRDFLAAQAGLHEKDAIIERQAEEIARLTAERSELIEALQPFAYPTDDAIQRAVALERARVLIERIAQS